MKHQFFWCDFCSQACGTTFGSYLTNSKEFVHIDLQQFVNPSIFSTGSAFIPINSDLVGSVGQAESSLVLDFSWTKVVSRAVLKVSRARAWCGYRQLCVYVCARSYCHEDLHSGGSVSCAILLPTFLDRFGPRIGRGSPNSFVSGGGGGSLAWEVD